MTYQVKVPELGESLVEATVGQWRRQEGDAVAIGDLLVDLETDKVDVEVGAESVGVLVNILRHAGEDVEIGDVLAEIDPGGTGQTEEQSAPQAAEESEPAKSQATESEASQVAEREEAPDKEAVTASPVAKRLAEENQIALDQIKGSGPNGRITRQDVEGFLRRQKSDGQDAVSTVEVDAEKAERPSADKDGKTSAERSVVHAQEGDVREERIHLSRRRRTIAERLIEAQQTAAILTTFNDADMSAIIALRKRRGESFQERFAVKLGFMSFFVKGTIAALKAYPRLNAAIDGDEMILKYHYDIGIAVGAEEGLIVPVIREADHKSFAEIEEEIADLANKARQGSLSLEDIRGGTFTISNGGVYGSLLSTPILNPPQVGILGLHRIEERPVAVEGEIVIRPMMYLALSYDHRLIDGREAVQFLGRLKEVIEDPETLLLEG